MIKRLEPVILILVSCFIITACPEDKISISLNLIPPCLSESKNFRNPIDKVSEISIVATKEENASAPEVITSARFPYESGGKGVFDIPLSKNVRIVVEGFDENNNMVLRGVSQLFDVTATSPTSIKVPIFVAGTDSFCQTTDFVTQECSVMNSGLQGSTVTPLPNGDVLIVGGVSVSGANRFYSSNIYLFNSQKGTFEEIEVDEQIKEYGKRAYHTATLYNKGTRERPEWKVLIAGGETYINGVASSIATAQIYDVQSKKVEFLTSTMEEGRVYHTATLLQNGKIAIIGGENKVGGKVEAYLDTVEIFDIQSETFSKLSGKDYHKMVHARSRHTATYLPLRYNTVDNEPISGFDKILIAGGIKKVGSQLYINDEMEIFGCANASCTDYRFDVVRKKDNTSLKMQQKRYGHQAVSVMIGSEPVPGQDGEEFYNYYVLFLGGYTCIGVDRCSGSTSQDCQCPGNNDVYASISRSVEILEPTSLDGPQIKNVTEMNIARADFGAVVIDRENDNVIIFGGYSTTQGTMFDVVEAMTVNKKSITKPRYLASKMLFPRADFGFSVFNGGNVFIVGGDNGKLGSNKSSLSTVEIFVPSLPVLSE